MGIYVLAAALLDAALLGAERCGGFEFGFELREGGNFCVDPRRGHEVIARASECPAVDSKQWIHEEKTFCDGVEGLCMSRRGTVLSCNGIYCTGLTLPVEEEKSDSDE